MQTRGSKIRKELVVTVRLIIIKVVVALQIRSSLETFEILEQIAILHVRWFNFERVILDHSCRRRATGLVRRAAAQQTEAELGIFATYQYLHEYLGGESRLSTEVAVTAGIRALSVA